MDDIHRLLKESTSLPGDSAQSADSNDAESPGRRDNDVTTAPQNLQGKQDGGSVTWFANTIIENDGIDTDQNDIRENPLSLCDTGFTDETLTGIRCELNEVSRETSESCILNVTSVNEVNTTTSFETSDSSSSNMRPKELETSFFVKETKKETSTNMNGNFESPDQQLDSCSSEELAIIADFAKQTRNYCVPNSAYVECIKEDAREPACDHKTKSLLKRRMANDTIDKDTRTKSKHKTGSKDSSCNYDFTPKTESEHKTGSKDTSRNCGVTNSALTPSNSESPVVTQEATVTRLIIRDHEKSRDISDIVLQAIERAQDGFPNSPVEVEVHIININNIRLRTLTSECHITIRALNPGHEMDPPPADRNLARDLELDYPSPMGQLSGPLYLSEFAVYDSMYKRLNPGDIIRLDHRLYTHFAVYVGEGFIVHFGQDGVACEKLFEVLGSASFTKFNDLDLLYRPRPIRDVILRSLSRYRDQGFLNSASFATWCRYGRAITLNGQHEDNNLSFLLGLSA